MMRHGHSARAAILVAAGVVLGVSASAQAGLTGSPLSITATNSRGSVTWNMPSNWLRTRETPLGTEWYYEGNLSWRGENDSGQLVWGFNPNQLMTVSFIEDPQISLNFGVMAGPADTVFSVSSALLSFATIPLPEGRATAGITASDASLNGNVGFTGLVGLPGGANKSYLAQYNGFVPGGTDFARLVSDSSGVGSAVSFEDFPVPAPNFSPIGVPVSDMSAMFGFRLTGGDIASVTSTYVIRPQIPTPGAGAILALGGVLLTRRRR